MPAVNYVAVIIAAFSGFLLGVLWYSRFLFGRRWERAAASASVDPDAPTPAGRGGASIGMIALTLVYNLVAAYLLAIFFTPSDPVITTVIVGAAIGFGCVATSLAISYAFTRCSTALLMIDGGFHLVRFAIMGLVLGLWH